MNYFQKCFFGFAIGLMMLIGSLSGAYADQSITSPDTTIDLTVAVDSLGYPTYSVTVDGKPAIHPSRLGFRFRDQASFEKDVRLEKVGERSYNKSWEQPWGERRIVRNHFNELTVKISDSGAKWWYTVSFRVFDDGVAFQYHMPEIKGYEKVAITKELTEFTVDQEATAWWIPARSWNRYEYIYETTGLDEIHTVHTPVTFKNTDDIHLTIHEAALVDYAGMSLRAGRDGRFKADLAPGSDGVLVHKKGAFKTPWRTIQIGRKATDLLNSNMILNLNEPNKLGDVSWVKPGKYVGIWWGMHIGDNTWGRDGIHGATTAETMKYIDFAAKYGFSGVLVEGWNIGWDGDWYNNGDVFSFTKNYPDYDFKALATYARSKGVEIIGHHETSGNVTNYENQMDAAYKLMQDRGVSQIKTGYVADGGMIKRIDDQGAVRYEYHDGQYMSNHHLNAIKKAAKHEISLNAHEPIKDTGLRRTYPNMITREGARGQEFNAWGIPPNPPEHTAILPYTRMMSGPMDFTPGIFNLEPSKRPITDPRQTRHDVRSRIKTTLMKQLALYVVLYSPIQMAADLPEHYKERMDAFQFIRDVPVDWEDSIALAGEVGDYVVYARKERKRNLTAKENAASDWYLGALTDEKAREISVDLSFLGNGTYQAQIYRDKKGADWNKNPYAYEIIKLNVTAKDKLDLWLAPGGGTAVRFKMLAK